jgi:tellurite resistance protein TerA
MHELMQGANQGLAAGGSVKMIVSWTRSPDDLDVACFLVGADGKVPSDDWMVFYNQPASPGRAVRLQADGKTVTFQIDLDALPAHIARCCFTATLDGAGTVAAIEGLTVGALVADTEVRFVPGQLGNERALMMVDVYRHASAWKMRAVAQGFNGGLAPLARHFGVSVAEDAGRSAPAAAPPQAQAPRAAPAVTPVSAGPVRLGKVTLDKPAQSTPVNLGKRADGKMEHLAVRMNWTMGVDLDLHAFYRLKSGAEGHVYFVNKGSLSGPPFIALDTDAGVGNSAGKNVENLTISDLSQLESVIFVANIFRFFGGSKENFAKYDGQVVVTTSLGEIVVPLTSKTLGKWAVIAKLENIDQPRMVNINEVIKDEPKLADY